MFPKPETSAKSGLLSRTGATIVALVFCVGLVGGMALVVLREVDKLSSSNADNLQWSLAQADVEYMRFRLALERAEDNSATLPDLRRRFDIFYSRMATMETGRVYSGLRDNPAYDEARQSVSHFLNVTVPYMDGPDDQLLSALPGIEVMADVISDDVQNLTLSGLAAFATMTDRLREEVLNTLTRLAVVLGVVLAGLVMLALALWRLNTLATRRAVEIQRTAARMRAIVETSLDAIVMSGSSGRIREFNTAAQRIFGYSRDEARQAEMLRLLFTPESREKLLEHVQKRFSGEFPAEHMSHAVEVEAIARGGRIFPAEISFDRAEAEDGLVYVSYIRDITRRKVAEEALTGARDRALAGEKAKAEFLAIMSHEMRTPLNGLLGTMQLIGDEPMTPRQTALLERMISSGQLLLGIVNDVLDLSKFEAGKLVAEKRPFNLPRLLDGVMATANPLAAENGNRLSWSWSGAAHDPANDWLSGDARRLRQVLLNLVGNAVKFTRDGSVSIEVEVVGHRRPEIEFRVIDTGIGISESDLERIFNDFETLDSSYARQAGGTGLGLGIARRLTGLMGGEIGAESEPGEGSLFWVRLPFQPATEPADTALLVEPDGGQAAADGKGLEILLVEDNEINRYVARQMLEASGHSVTEAADGRAGVAAAESRRFDLILMDISMPVMDGQQAAQRIRNGGGPSAETPIIAVTAHALPEEVERFRRSGMADCISKPLERNELLAAVARVLSPDQMSGAVPGRERCMSEAHGGLLDLELLAALRRDLTDEAATTLLNRFIAETDAALVDLTGPDAAWDELSGMARLLAEVHRTAGSCGTFGAVALRRDLISIETACKTGSVPEEAALQSLHASWKKTRAALIAWSEMAVSADF